ncbi:prepilin-type N-terminal cleavage/methylation domain-containing protein [Salmonella enterica]|nr:prepilin-type N-terminal cleavage/methylation domain-containing protein [Salmonella enterica]
MKRTSNRGSILIEVIIAIAIIGMVMLAAAEYARKEIDKAHRQNISDIIVTEISSFLSFVNHYELEVYKADGTKEKKINPLYDIPLPGTPDLRPDYYKNRLQTKIEDDLNNNSSSFINWGKYTPGKTNAERNYFLDSACGGTGSNTLPVNMTSGMNFVDHFLNCERKWENSEFDIDRINLIGNQDKGSIDRVDFFLAFNEITENNGFEIFNYVIDLQRAFDKAGYFVQAAYLISRNKGESPQNWELVKYGSGTLSSRVDVMKPDNYDFLSRLSRNLQYGIRFSMKADGMNLRADGSVNADKLCWNPVDDAPVICIASNKYSTHDDPMLSATVSPGQNPASLSVKELIFNNGIHTNLDGTTYNKYSTVPVIDYVSFTGENKSKIKVENNYSANVNDEEGFITRDIQTCPLNPEGDGAGNPKRLYPRMAVALSSFVAESLVDNSKRTLESDLSKLKSNRNKLSNLKGQEIDQIKGIVIQVNQSTINKPSGEWLISASTGVKNDGTGAYNIINPKSLSLLVTTWCSTEEQDSLP